MTIKSRKRAPARPTPSLRTALRHWRALPNATRENLVAYLEDDTKERRKDLEGTLMFDEASFYREWIAANEAAFDLLNAARKTRVRRRRSPKNVKKKRKGRGRK